MAETVEIQCSDPCPSCEMSCETPAVLERLDALLARECPDCVCPAVESAPADTAPGNGESVKEGVWLLNPTANSVVPMGVGDVPVIPARPKSWASRHPVWTSIFVSAGAVILYAVLDDDDARVVREGDTVVVNAPCWPPVSRHCR
jgi:hypothetical protein